jgi:hypothetical protein
MALVTTLNSLRSQEIRREGGPSRARPGTPQSSARSISSGSCPRRAAALSWPPPIRMNARTELPPLPRKPVYGPAARDEVRRILREAGREGINFGWFTRMNLYRVIKGERPLSYSEWERAQEYVRQVRRERKREQEVRQRPLQFRVVPGQGPVVGWRQGSPPRGVEPNAPKGIQDPNVDRVRRPRREVRAHAPGRVSVPSCADAGSGPLASRWTSVATPWSCPWPRQEAERTNR